MCYARGELKFGGKDPDINFQATTSTCAGVHLVPLDLQSMASHISHIIADIMLGKAADDKLVPTGGHLAAAEAATGIAGTTSTSKATGAFRHGYGGRATGVTVSM